MKRAVLVLLLVACKQPAATPSAVPDAATAAAAAPRVPDAGPAVAVRPTPRAGEVKTLGDKGFELLGHTEAIIAVALDKTGRLAATGGLDRSVRLWDLEAQKQLWAAGPGDEAVTTLVFDPEGQTLAAGDRAFQVRLFSVKDGELLQRRAHPDAVAAISWSPDGKWLAVAGTSGNAEVYPRDDGPSKCELRGRTVDFTDDGKKLVSATQTGMLITTSFPECKKLKETSTLPQAPQSSASASAKQVATFNGGEPLVMLWDAAAGRMLGKLDKQGGPVTTVVLSPDGTRALVASADRRVRLYDTAKLEVLRSFEVAAMPFAAMTPDATTLLVADNIVARVIPLTGKAEP